MMVATSMQNNGGDPMSNDNSRMAVQYPANPVVARLIRLCLFNGESHVEEMYWLAMHEAMHEEIEEDEQNGVSFLPFVRHTRKTTRELVERFEGDRLFQVAAYNIRRGDQYE
jgi:hypothetical protein